PAPPARPPRVRPRAEAAGRPHRRRARPARRGLAPRPGRARSAPPRPRPVRHLRRLVGASGRARLPPRRPAPRRAAVGVLRPRAPALALARPRRVTHFTGVASGLPFSRMYVDRIETGALLSLRARCGVFAGTKKLSPALSFIGAEP